MLEINKVYNKDFFEGIRDVEDKSIDMILCDLPYNKTKNKWDVEIDLDKLWLEYNRVIKDNGAIVLTAQDKFSAKLMLSNEKYHRYNLVWDKVLTSGFLNANKMPLRSHEDILVFYKKLPTYNPQKTLGKPNNSRGLGKGVKNNNYGDFGFVDNREELGNLKHPKSIIKISKQHNSTMKHPTQKPVELFNWLIRTYTNEEDLVLDTCMGSGTTAISCIETNRQYIGFELEEEYYKLIQERIRDKLKEISNEKKK